MYLGASKFLSEVFFIVVMMFIILKATKEKEPAREKKEETKKETVVYDPDGTRTEYLVREKLKSLFGLRPAVSVLLPAGDITTEIDLAQATTKGILVVECKSRSECVEGHVKSDSWEVGKTKIPMENPIKQNFYHVNAVKKYLKDRLGDVAESIPVVNVTVILSKRADISGLETLTEARCLTSVAEVETLKSLPDVLSEEKAAELQELLYDKEATVEELEKHIENLRKKHSA